MHVAFDECTNKALWEEDGWYEGGILGTPFKPKNGKKATMIEGILCSWIAFRKNITELTDEEMIKACQRTPMADCMKALKLPETANSKQLYDALLGRFSERVSD